MIERQMIRQIEKGRPIALIQPRKQGFTGDSKGLGSHSLTFKDITKEQFHSES